MWTVPMGGGSTANVPGRMEQSQVRLPLGYPPRATHNPHLAHQHTLRALHTFSSVPSDVCTQQGGCV
jgi:hypothetical protein